MAQNSHHLPQLHRPVCSLARFLPASSSPSFSLRPGAGRRFIPSGWTALPQDSVQQSSTDGGDSDLRDGAFQPPPPQQQQAGHGGLRQMVNKAFNRRSGVTPASGGPLSGALPPKGPLPAPPVRPTPPLPPSPQSPPPSVTPSVGRLDPSTDSAFGVKFVSAEHLSCKEWHERPFPLRRGVTTGESFVAECDPYWQRRLL